MKQHYPLLEGAIITPEWVKLTSRALHKAKTEEVSKVLAIIENAGGEYISDVDRFRFSKLDAIEKLSKSISRHIDITTEIMRLNGSRGGSRGDKTRSQHHYTVVLPNARRKAAAEKSDE